MKFSKDTKEKFIASLVLLAITVAVFFAVEATNADRYEKMYLSCNKQLKEMILKYER